MMKKVKTILGVICLAIGVNASAQHDIKMDFFGFVIEQYGIQYEKVLNDEMGVGADINYHNYTIGGGFGDDLEFSGFNIVPEFRFYFSPEDGADGFYVGPYLKYKRATSNGFNFYDSEGIYRKGDKTTTGLAFGVGVGKKWVADAGFIFETYFGLGRYIVENDTYDSSAQEAYWKDNDIDGLPPVDGRLSLSIGWRIN